MSGRIEPTSAAVEATGNAQRLRDVNAPAGFLNTTRAVPTNGEMRIEVVNPSANADPVLHVQDATTGDVIFVAGNDNCTPGVPSSGSCVILPASIVPEVRIIVRPYATGTGGSATLRITTPSGTEEFNFTFDGTVIDVPPLTQGARILTVLQNRGFASPATQPSAFDTNLLVSRDIEHGIAFNDNSAMGFMSRIDLPAACSSLCQIVVASSGMGSSGGVTTVIWDEDIAFLGNDPDQDGLSTALETTTSGASIGTNPNDSDSDDDGIPDGVEVMGYVRPKTRNSFDHYPFYGAEPLQPDIFVEVDWVGSNQWSAEAAQTVANAFLGNPGGDPDLQRDIHVHIDNGVANPNTDSRRFVWGDWGGATQIEGAPEFCSGFTLKRQNFFHHGVSGVGETSSFGKCFLASPGNGAHELGHNFIGSHGGFPDAGLNGNAIYRSVMNYAFAGMQPPRFSLQQFGDLRLNPSQVNEVSWAQGLDPSLFQYLTQFTAVENEKVDWNQDNAFTNGNVRGQINFGNEMGKWHNQALTINGASLKHALLSWLPGSPNKLFLFALNGSGISYWTSTNVNNCANFLTNHWGPPYCNSWSGPSSVPNLSDVSGHFGVTWYVPSQGSVRNLMLVYRKTDNTLRYQIFDGSTGQWSGEQPLPRNTGVMGGPSIIRSTSSDSALLVYAPISTRNGHQIYRWRFSAGVGWGEMRVAENYSDDTPVLVNPEGGIALAHGYLAGQPKGLFAAIVTSIGENLIKIARYDRQTNRWVPLSTLNDNPGLGTTKWGSSVRPGFAYVPFTNAPDRESQATGRFYLLYRDTLQSSPAIVKTVGNDPNPVIANGLRQRDLAWHKQGWEWFLLSWDKVDSSIQLSYDFDLDTNMRGVYSIGNIIVWAPIADGRANAEFRDYDDLKVFRGRLACAVAWNVNLCLIGPGQW